MNDTPATPGRFDLEFLGANATVTGSRYLVTAGRRSWSTAACSRATSPCACATGPPFPVDPASHRCGGPDPRAPGPQRLPAATGPRTASAGRVWCTSHRAACAGSCSRTPPACWKRKPGTRTAAAPRSTIRRNRCTREADARASLAHLQGVGFEQAFEPAPGVSATFRTQGHILGAAAVTLEFDGKRITFSGDLGRPTIR